MKITEELKHIKANTIYVEAKEMLTIELTKTFQMSCTYGDIIDWSFGDIQKIHLDNKGEAIAYDVYTY